MGLMQLLIFCGSKIWWGQIETFTNRNVKVFSLMISCCECQNLQRVHDLLSEYIILLAVRKSYENT